MTTTANGKEYTMIIKTNNFGQDRVYISHEIDGKSMIDSVVSMFTSNGRIMARQIPSNEESFKRFAKKAYQIQKDIEQVEQLEALI